MTQFTYRHKRIARYLIGRFEFKDHVLRLKDADEDEEFRDLMSKQPPRESRDIVQIDERAFESLQQQLGRGSRVVRHAQDSANVPSAVQGSGRALSVDSLSPEDRARIEAQAYADAKKEMELRLNEEKRVADEAEKVKAAEAARLKAEQDTKNPNPTGDQPQPEAPTKESDTKQPEQESAADKPKANVKVSLPEQKK